MSLLEKIHSRGYWEVIIRPSTFIEARIPDINSLQPILQKCSYRRGGWEFPFIDQSLHTHIDIDWIGQEFEFGHFLSAWRFYQSGLFVDTEGMLVDWQEQANWLPPTTIWEPGKWLGVEDSIRIFTSIFEFAARLSLTEAGDEKMVVNTEVYNIKGRKLFTENPRMAIRYQKYTASLDKYPIPKEMVRSELIANSSEYAIDAANELFKRFGWNTTKEILKGFQEEIMKR